MLTATYSQIAIRNEHDALYKMLRRLQCGIREAWNRVCHIESRAIQSLFQDLLQFDEYRRQRKVEAYLIPIVRRATREADALLAELAMLGIKATAMLDRADRLVRQALRHGLPVPGELRGAMELYCAKLQARLQKEDEELFPLVQRVFSVEQWFAVAEKFLSADGQIYRGRHLARAAPPPFALEAALPGGAVVVH